jgi:hypothetical protein
VTALAAVALAVLTLVGAGLYALVPLVGSPEEDALEAVESYVTAWAEKRCEDAAELIDGPREEILVACDDDVATESLEIRTTEVELDGDRGTATLQVRYRENGEPRVRDIVEELVRVDGQWKVAWRRR